MLKWSAITKAREFKDGFLLLTSPRIGRWFPLGAFRSPGDVALFRKWISECATRQRKPALVPELADVASDPTPASRPAATATNSPPPAATDGAPKPSIRGGEAGVVAVFRWDQAEATRAYQAGRRVLPWWLRHLALLVMVPIMLAVVVVQPTWSDAVPFLIFFPLVAGFLVWRMGAKQRKEASDIFTGSPDANREVRWMIHSDRITIEGRHSDTTVPWKSVHRVAETADGFVVYFHPRAGSWLPHHAFARPEDAALFRAWINRYGIDYRRI
jgi:hypothetical protein